MRGQGGGEESEEQERYGAYKFVGKIEVRYSNPEDKEGDLILVYIIYSLILVE